MDARGLESVITYDASGNVISTETSTYTLSDDGAFSTLYTSVDSHATITSEYHGMFITLPYGTYAIPPKEFVVCYLGLQKIATVRYVNYCGAIARQRTQIQARIKDLDNIIRCLYEDRVCGRITPERYHTMASGFEQEQAELKRELESIAARFSEMDLREQDVREFVEMPRHTKQPERKNRKVKRPSGNEPHAFLR